MSIKDDEAGLVDRIQAIGTKIDDMTPRNFTEAECLLTIEAIRVLNAREKLSGGRSSYAVADITSAIAKVQRVLAEYTSVRKSLREFAESITEEERQIILDRRAAGRASS